MSGIRRVSGVLVKSGKLLEAAFDRFRFELKLRLGRLEPVEILAYRGHGTGRMAYIRGRVLEESGITRSTQTDTILNNLRNMARRFISSEVPYARVRGTYAGVTLETTADEEGFFEFTFDLDAAGVNARPPSADFEWHPVDLELISPFAQGQTGETERGWVMTPVAPEFGIISDVDDTVVRSQATNVLKMLWIVLLNNAHTRLPFEGVGQLYRGLKAGSDGRQRNPLFYISSSPWNIFDVLVDFMDVHGLPHGPIFLKDWSPTVLTAHEDHKLERIATVLDTYPDLQFVLFGDSGEEDPEIYHKAALDHPDRIKAIFIRDVTGHERDAEVQQIAAELRKLGVTMRYVSDSATAAEAAHDSGLISRDNAREVFRHLP